MHQPQLGIHLHPTSESHILRTSECYLSRGWQGTPWLALVGTKPSSAAAALFHVLGRDLHAGEARNEPGSVVFSPFLELMGTNSPLYRPRWWCHPGSWDCLVSRSTVSTALKKEAARVFFFSHQRQQKHGRVWTIRRNCTVTLWCIQSVISTQVMHLSLSFWPRYCFWDTCNFLCRVSNFRDILSSAVPFDIMNFLGRYEEFRVPSASCVVRRAFTSECCMTNLSPPPKKPIAGFFRHLVELQITASSQLIKWNVTLVNILNIKTSSCAAEQRLQTRCQEYCSGEVLFN